MKEQLYRHYKDSKLYKINNFSKEEKSGITLVTYYCVNEQYPTYWTRPETEFFGKNKEGIPRFNPIFPLDEIKGQKLFNSTHDKVIEDLRKEDNPIDEDLQVYDIYKEVIRGAIKLKQMIGSETTIEEDLIARRKKGLTTYGKYLTPFNGRDALQDAYEECLDLLNYLKQRLMEDSLSKEYLKEHR